MTSEGWRETTLGRVIGGRKAVLTGPFGSQLRASEYVSSGIPVVMPKNLRNGLITTEKIARISSQKAAVLARYRLKAGDVLLARRGEMGRCVLIDPSQEGWVCGTGCLRLRPEDRVDGRFLAQLLRWHVTTAWLAVQAVGQTLPSLNAGILDRLPLRLPELMEQRRIADVLECAEHARKAARGVTDRARRVREGFLRLLVTHGPEQALLNGRVFAPREWPSRPIGALCSMSNGRAFRVAERSRYGLPIIRIQNLNGSTVFHRYRGMPAPDWTVEAGDLLFAWAGVRGSSFGPRLWRGPKGVLNQHIFKVRPVQGVVKDWLLEALKIVTQELAGRAQGFKTSLLHIRKRDLMEHRIAVPPLEVQRWIAVRSQALSEMEAADHATLKRLAKIEHGLRHDLLSGRVRTV